MFDTCNDLGCGASISIFEPGFLRVVLAYHAAGMVTPGSIVKLYFGGGRLIFGMPPTLSSLEAYLAMLEGSDLPWAVAVRGGDVVASGLARLALERCGHVREGLEDYSGPRRPANRELVEEVAALSTELGRPLATSADARRILSRPVQA